MSSIPNDEGAEAPAVLLYDEDCGFCKWCLNRILAWDRRHRLRPVAIGSPEGASLLSSLSEEERWDSFHVVTPDGQVHSAGAAAAPLAERLPGAAPIGLIARRLPGPTERAYRLVAGNRTRLARLVGVDASCEVRTR
ncbi:DUF393 domain-containing protein [Thermoleophilia bacterium SCSIO 60948]|nr:DUF393 domain-containing protein [Thermoleophilia bacterium SCSIO 60948]